MVKKLNILHRKLVVIVAFCLVSISNCYSMLDSITIHQTFNNVLSTIPAEFFEKNTIVLNIEDNDEVNAFARYNGCDSCYQVVLYKGIQELMISFYTKWLSGKSKREAFKEAQKELYDKYTYPYFWGAFVLVGE